jgi:hypothetical protein
MTYTVAISEITTQFHKAHHSVVESLGGYNHIIKMTNGNHWEVLAKNWQLKYGIKPRNGSGSTSWKYLDFPDEKSYTMFLLRWS